MNETVTSFDGSWWPSVNAETGLHHSVMYAELTMYGVQFILHIHYTGMDGLFVVSFKSFRDIPNIVPNRQAVVNCLRTL